MLEETRKIVNDIIGGQAMGLTTKDELTVLAVFDSLLHKPYSELNTFLGSETIERMTALYWELERFYRDDEYNCWDEI